MAACAVAAWCVVLGRRGLNGRPGYKTIAWLLTWFTASNLLRAFVQVQILDPARAAIGPDAPYSWPVRGWYLFELAMRTAWPFAILATALVVLLRRGPWPAALGWAFSATALCVAYPALRRVPQAQLEGWIALGCWTLTVLAGWYGHFRHRMSREECYAPLVFIVAAQAAVILVVKFGSYPEQDWMIARVLQGTAYAGLLAYQLWILGERTS